MPTSSPASSGEACRGAPRSVCSAARRALPPALLLTPLALACGSAEGGAQLDRPHLIVVSLDTLRADHLSCYGYERPTSPRIDALAEESWLFENVFATSATTAPSHMTIFTGTLLRVHGIRNGQPAQLAPDVPYLPELLAASGYRTAAFADGGLVTEPFGFTDGFEHFDSTYERFDRKLDRVEEWLADAPDEPTFLFVHTYGVHQPYLPLDGHDLFTDPDYAGGTRDVVQRLIGRRDRGEGKALADMQRVFVQRVSGAQGSDLDYVIGLYDGCIHGVDAGVGRLLDMLERRGWLDHAWLVVTSDHGEAFGEHGTFSHRKLHREELWVPLIVRPPGGTAPRRVAARISQLDLGPTMLDAIGQPVHPAMQGRSLLPFESLSDRRAFATENNQKQDAVVDGGWKLIHGAASELYALDADPAEARNLAEAEAESARRAALERMIEEMSDECAELQSRLGAPAIGNRIVDSELADELRALGYVEEE